MVPSVLCTPQMTLPNPSIASNCSPAGAANVPEPSVPQQSTSLLSARIAQPDGNWSAFVSSV
jgi:hypothetical protein